MGIADIAGTALGNPPQLKGTSQIILSTGILRGTSGSKAEIRGARILRA